MSEEISGNGLDVTLREFVSGQKLFNRYRLIKTLGRGGMGVVWLARDEELERDVALKFLPDLIIRDRAVLSDLKRETRRSLELTHKNIVRIYDFVHDQTSGCISMEYVDGDTLSNLRADKPHKVFESDELKDWVSQLCDALDYAHNHARIVHRDLKPANLMVNQRGDLKVADFGIARSLSDSVSKLTMDHGKSGTLVYMSPQQLEGERGTHLDDVYSLGASLYELLTSKPPFYSGNVDRQIREKIPPSMTQRRKELEIEGEPIDAAWEEVIRACLAKNPERRPQSVSDIAKRLEVPSPGTRRAARAGAKKSRKLVSILGAAGFLLLAAAGILYFGFYRPMQNRQLRFASPAAPQPSQPEATAPPVAAASPQSKPVQTEATTSPVAAISPSSSAAPEVTDKLQATRAEPPKLSSLSPAPSQFAAKVAETPRAPAGPKVTANAIYEGTIHAKNDSSTNVPLAITIGSDLKSGTMTQSGRRGDVVVKFSGIWDENTLHAVTDEVVSAPKEIKWSPESFTLRFADDGKTASYECFAGSKTYIADLSAQSSSGIKPASLYKGKIWSTDTPLAINFDADRKSGTLTETSKSGDTVVKFNGVWDGDVLYAVTGEVVSKPKKVQWKPESFTMRLSEDAKRLSYKCNDEGVFLTAELSPP